MTLSITSPRGVKRVYIFESTNDNNHKQQSARNQIKKNNVTENIKAVNLSIAKHPPSSKGHEAHL